MGCVGKIVFVLFVASVAWAERVQLKPKEAFQALVGNSTRNSRELLQASLPFLETYWESYLSWPFDYDSCSTGVPTFQPDETAFGYSLASLPVGNNGVDIVNIAFAYNDVYQYTYCLPYIAGLHIFEDYAEDSFLYLDLVGAIASLQAQGALVKLSYGGEEWGQNTAVFDSWWETPYDVDILVERIVSDVNNLNLDGVDLAQQMTEFFSHFSQLSSIQLMILERLRIALPSKIISYTFPTSPDAVLYHDILKYGHPYVDYFNVHRGDQADADLMASYGVPLNKIVWGTDLRCDDSTEPKVTNLDDALNLAAAVRSGGYAGASVWSINKDTDHRPGQTGCTELQTGQPDGAFVLAMHNELNL